MKKIIIIGGDNRFKNLKEALEEKAYRVETLGLYENDCGSISDSEVIVLPVPSTKDKTNVFTPLTGRIIPLSLITENARRSALCLTCGYTAEGLDCIDYGSSDSYALRNAVPTAEGALKLAVENTSRTLFGAKVLVIGFGRVGKITADRFKRIGCDVTVSTGGKSNFALCEALGFKCVNTAGLGQIRLDYGIIINTADAEVISEAALKNISSELLLDLSTYGGFSLSAAKALGLNAIKAPGLPLLTAPQSAAEILTDTVTNIIEKYDKE